MIVEKEIGDSLMYSLYGYINDFIKINMKEPVLIIMHPETWHHIIYEAKIKQSMIVDDYNLKFKGIDVVRSYDIVNTNFNEKNVKFRIL